MAHIYFTRHGQTVWNVENKICGATDSPLTELGHKQAIELGEKINHENLQIDEISMLSFVQERLTLQTHSRNHRCATTCRTAFERTEFWQV